MRTVNRQTGDAYARHVSAGGRSAVDYFAPETEPYLTDDYFEARDRRRAQKTSARRKRWAWRATLALCAGLAGLTTFIFLTDAGQQITQDHALYQDFERLAIAAGFGINQVSLEGHRYTSDEDIFDALDLANTKSLLSFDPVALRERLQRLPWIRTVTAARVFPGQLRIQVSEREPAAVWQRGNQDYLIDTGGRVLAAVAPGMLTHLPRLKGEGVASVVGQIFALLDQFPDVSGFVMVSERISERRWRLRLVGGGAIELPSDQEVRALRDFLAQPDAIRLVQSGDRIIDLRGQNRISIRAIPPKTQLSARKKHRGQSGRDDHGA